MRKAQVQAIVLILVLAVAVGALYFMFNGPGMAFGSGAPSKIIVRPGDKFYVMPGVDVKAEFISRSGTRLKPNFKIRIKGNKISFNTKKFDLSDQFFVIQFDDGSTIYIDNFGIVSGAYELQYRQFAIPSSSGALPRMPQPGSSSTVVPLPPAGPVGPGVPGAPAPGPVPPPGAPAPLKPPGFPVPAPGVPGGNGGGFGGGGGLETTIDLTKERIQRIHNVRKDSTFNVITPTVQAYIRISAISKVEVLGTVSTTLLYPFVSLFQSNTPTPDFDLRFTKNVYDEVEMVIEYPPSPLPPIVPGPKGAGAPFGDFNYDGDVNILDFDIIKSNFGRTDALPIQGDADSDGDVDGSDFLVWKSNSFAAP